MEFRKFTPEEHGTWATLYGRQAPLRAQQVSWQFDLGLELLDIPSNRVPDLSQVNRTLSALTGWTGVPVTGHEDPKSFFPMLAERKFPIGNFIRDSKDINYTPAPDVFHDLYGHLPFLANEDYANFCKELGERASKYLDNPEKLRPWERLFWFGVEFPLIRSGQSRDLFGGRKILGAGIVSSFGECAYALSDKPEVRAFNVYEIGRQEFRIDIMQPILYLLEHEEQLYGCLSEFEQALTNGALRN